MSSRPSSLRSPQAKALLIVTLVIALAVFSWMAPAQHVILHNVLHHLNILPFMLAGMFFGWRGALKTILLATVLQGPSIYRHWFQEPLDAQDQVVEISTFGAGRGDCRSSGRPRTYPAADGWKRPRLNWNTCTPSCNKILTT